MPIAAPGGSLGHQTSRTLLIGGVRSGKSTTAERLAAASGRAVVFVATAEARDAEMADRIARHRTTRPAHWTTIEEPIGIAAAITAAPPESFVVVDCLTLWVANLLGAQRSDRIVLDDAEELAAVLANRHGGVAIVTNEVGMGVHPSTPLGREYRDLLGAVNSRIAAAVDRVWLMMAGRALALTDPLELAML